RPTRQFAKGWRLVTTRQIGEPLHIAALLIQQAKLGTAAAIALTETLVLSRRKELIPASALSMGVLQPGNQRELFIQAQPILDIGLDIAGHLVELVGTCPAPAGDIGMAIFVRRAARWRKADDNLV